MQVPGNAVSALGAVRQRHSTGVRGTGAASDESDDEARVLTVSRAGPALIALDHDGKLLERIDA